MANPWAGEVALVLGGQRRVMKLTLGALAELEQELGADSLVELAQRFENAAFSSSDVLALIVAGLRGGGWDVSRGDVAHAEIEGGALEAARKAAEVLARAFMTPGQG